MPARDISAIAEDMIDTLLEEGFGSDDVYDITQSSLAVYLTLMQELVLGELATEDAVEAAADEAAHLVVERVRIQKEEVSSRPVITANEITIEVPSGPAPTRFERDPVI